MDTSPDTFVLKDRDEVDAFDKLLRVYCKHRTDEGFGLPNRLPLVEAYDKTIERSDGAKVFAAVLDIVINFVLLGCDAWSVGATWNARFSKGKLEGGSVLDSEDRFIGKMDIHRFFSSYVLRYRALWDKIMGLLILLFSATEYEGFIKAKHKKRHFKKLAANIPQIPPEMIKLVDDSLTQFDDTFRTAEAHETGRLRKWTFSMASMEQNPQIELLGFWNLLNDTMAEIGRLL